jgi:hypothetical protein
MSTDNIITTSEYVSTPDDLVCLFNHMMLENAANKEQYWVKNDPNKYWENADDQFLWE